MNKLSKILFTSFASVLFVFTWQSFVIHAETYPVEGDTIILPKELVDDNVKDDKKSSIFLTNENYLLEGLVDRVAFYYEVPVSGLKQDNYIYLHVNYSERLLPGSTITVSVDGEPVESFDLLKNKTTMDVRVPLTGDAVKRGIHHITVSFYGHLSEDMCANEENPANWLTILSDSHVNLQTDGSLLSRSNMLEDYPYPFIENERAQSMIVIPNQPSEEILTAALQLASFLSNVTTDKETIKIVSEADVKKVSSNLIAIGAADQWEGIIAHLFTSIDEPVNDGEVVVRNRLLQFPKVTKQIMFITATEDEKITENISLLTDTDYIEQLTRNDLAVQTLQEVEAEEIKDTIPFKDLQIPNITLNGIQTMSENYFYHVPTYVDKNADAYIHLKLKVAETLALQDSLSELVVYVNHIPHSIAINDLEELEDNYYKVAIPVSGKLLQQERYVTLQFRGHGLKEREICVPPTDEKWMFIHEDSYLQVPLINDGDQDASFQAWPVPFNTTTEQSETTIILLHDINEKVITQLQKVTNSLATNGSIDGLQIVNGNISDEDLQDRNVILLGNLHEWPDLEKHKENLLVPVADNGNLLVNEFGFLNETAQYISFMQPSLWNEDKLLTVFSAIHPNEDSFLSGDLVDYLVRKKTSATIAIQSENGEIFTNKVAEQTDRKPTFDTEEKTSQTWVMYTFIGIFVISIIIFIFVIRRTRKRKVQK